jgi:hypothetical protein
MALSFDELARQSGDMLSQIRGDLGNWNVVITSIVAVVVVCWIMAECVHYFQDRKRMRQRFAKPLV